MAKNAPELYGRDVRCLQDADALFTEAVGIDIVRQDALHRITTDNVLGDDGTGSFMLVGWGFDCRRLLGMPASKLAQHQPIISEVLQRDERILSADVRLTPVKHNGLDDVEIRVRCVTALGPFDLIKLASQLTIAELAGQA